MGYYIILLDAMLQAIELPLVSLCIIPRTYFSKGVQLWLLLNLPISSCLVLKAIYIFQKQARSQQEQQKHIKVLGFYFILIHLHTLWISPSLFKLWSFRFSVMKQLSSTEARIFFSQRWFWRLFQTSDIWYSQSVKLLEQSAPLHQCIFCLFHCHRWRHLPSSQCSPKL